MYTPNYSVLSAKVYIGSRDANGNPVGLQWVGDADICKLTFATTVKERQESYSGRNQVVASVPVGESGKIELDLKDISSANLAIALNGTVIPASTGSVTGEILGSATSPSVGDVFPLVHAGVSSDVLTDSSTSPKSLTNGTNYSLNAATGSITIIALPSGFTGPIQAAYSFTEKATVATFTALNVERYVYVEGVNAFTGAGSAGVRVSIPRVRFNPAKDLDLISKDFISLQLDGDVLVDLTLPVTGPLGQWAVVKQI